MTRTFKTAGEARQENVRSDKNLRACIRHYLDRVKKFDPILSALAGLAVQDEKEALSALAEAYAMTKDEKLKPRLKKAAEKALSFALNKARQSSGAWALNYKIKSEDKGDSILTGWFVLALESCRKAGLEVTKNDIAKTIKWYDSVTNPASMKVGRYEKDDCKKDDIGQLAAIVVIRTILNFFLMWELEKVEKPDKVVTE